MSNQGLRSRLRSLSTQGLVALMFIVAGMVFALVGLIRALQGGKPVALIFIGLALLAVGQYLGRRDSKSNGPRTPE